MTAFSFSTVLWGNTFSELAKRTDVSRLEFAMFKIEQKLKEELDDSLGLRQIDDLYDPAKKGNFKVHLQLSGNDLYIVLVLNEYMSCYNANPRFQNERMRVQISSWMDYVAQGLMVFFGNYGEYEGKSLQGNNMVHFRIAELFGYLDMLSNNEEHLALGKAISENFKIYIEANYCEKESETGLPVSLKYVYPLNADYDRNANTENGEKKFPERTQLEW